MTTCPFCGADPFHYVDNGVGMERVAITCCDLGCAAFDHRWDDDTEIQISSKELREIGDKLMRQQLLLNGRDEFIAGQGLWDKFILWLLSSNPERET